MKFFGRSISVESPNVAVQMTGQTGNQMFGLMAGLNQSKRLNCTLELCFSEVPNLLTEFKLNESILMNYGTNWSTYDLFEEESSHKFSDSINAIKPRTLLKGYFQNYRYFQHIDKSETISIFQLKEPKPTFVEYSKQINNRKILGIHVRCYEYGHREFHGILPPEYFRESVLLAKKLNDIDDIVVFTDNKFEASKILSDAWINPSEIIDSSKAISASETILLMSKVKSFIGSNSSFSWWSAYLCQDVDRVSIFPRPWYKNHETIIGSQYLPKWITIGFNKWL